MFGLRYLKKLRHLKHLGKIRHNLDEIHFELKWLRETVRDEIDRREGNFFAADVGGEENYSTREKVSKDTALKIEEEVKQDLGLEEDDKVVAITPPWKAYILKSGDK